MPSQVDLELLRRLGILPGTAFPGGLPGGDTSSKGDTVEAAPPKTTPSPSYNTPTIPWRQTTPSAIPGAPATTAYLDLPKTPTPGGGWGITAPGGEGTASWQPGGGPSTYMSPTPAGQPFEPRTTDTAAMLQEKEAQRQAAEVLANKRAEQAATVNVRNQMYQKDMMQRALQQLVQTNPAQALQFMQQQQTGGLTPAQLTAGSDEAQAFRMIVAQQGLPAALAWLQQQGGGRRGPLTPDELFQRVLAETRARYGPEAQGLRGATAEVTSEARATGAQAPTIPLSPTEAGRAGVPMGTTKGDVAGQVLTTPAQRGAIHDLDVGRFMLESIGQMADQLIVAEGPGEAAAQGIQLNLGALTRSNTVAATFDDQRKALLGILSRQIGAERGVLTDRDINRIDDALPHFRDTKPVKDKKLAFLRGMFDVSVDARRQAVNALLGSAPGGKGGGALSRANPGEEVRQDQQGRSYINRGGQVIEVQR